MFSAIKQYFQDLTKHASLAWDQYWFQKQDPISLSWLRIVVGFIVLFMLFQRTPDLIAFYTNEGVVHLDGVKELSGDQFRFSYLDYISSNRTLSIAHYTAMGIVVLFIFGVFTRVTSVLTLLICLSYWHRAPLITGEAEPILAFTLLYLAIAKCGGTFSIDRYFTLKKRMKLQLAGKNAEANKISLCPSDYATNVATGLFKLHITLVYFLMALAKLGGNGDFYPWFEGDATWWLIARPETTPYDLSFLHEYQYVYEFWTHFIVWFQFIYCIFIWNRWARPILVALSIPAWISVYLLTGNWIWAAVMIALNLAFIEPKSIRGFVRNIIGEDKIKVMFDGQCTMCQASVGTIKGVDINDTVELVDFTKTEPSDHHPDLTFDKCMQQMYVIEADGKLSGGYNGLVRIARKLPGLWFFGLLTFIPGHSAIGNKIYPEIAKRRFRNVQCDDDGTCHLHAEAHAKN